MPDSGQVRRVRRVQGAQVQRRRQHSPVDQECGTAGSYFLESRTKTSLVTDGLRRVPRSTCSGRKLADLPTVSR